METIKDQLYTLIEKSENEVLLSLVHQIITNEPSLKENKFPLTIEQEKELSEAYYESFEEANLIDHETLLKKHAKWLED